MKRMMAFTLPEVIIAMSVAILVGTLLLAILVNNTGLFYQQSSRLRQGVGLNDSLLKLRESIKEANSVAESYTSGVTYTSGAQQLVLQLPAIDLSGNKIFNVYDFAVYTVEEGRLYFKVFPDSVNGSVRKAEDRILTFNVSSIQFEYLDTSNNLVVATAADKVRVTLTLKEKAGAKFETSVDTSEANLRND